MHALITEHAWTQRLLRIQAPKSWTRADTSRAQNEMRMIWSENIILADELLLVVFEVVKFVDYGTL